MLEKWLIENAAPPIKYILTQDKKYIPEVPENFEVKYWLTKLKDRVYKKDLSNIHGSHDYRYENIVGKCAVLGLSKDMPELDESIKFFTDFLNKHIKNKDIDEQPLSFGKIYAYRDYETIMACFLPMLGYHDDPAVKYITEKRINTAYNFTKQKRYDIYIDSSSLKGVKKEWRPYIINPELYSDGNISLPSYHDYILFAGMYKYLDESSREKVENIVGWLLNDEYCYLRGRYGYFYAEGGSYNAKAIIQSVRLSENLYTAYILSHFKTARNSDWFRTALAYFDDYKTADGTYNFPEDMLTEKPDNYVIGGGHMNVGESRKLKKYREILSAYWMYRIERGN